MKRVAAFLGIIVVLVVGFVLLGNSRKAGGAAPAGGVTMAANGGKEHGGAPKGPMAMPVLVDTVTTRDVKQDLDVTGSLRTDEDVQVGARIEGKVVRVTVKEGDHVTRGQVLVQLDDREMRAQLARAEGTLASARAKLSQARNESGFKDTSSQTDYQRAQGALSTAKARLTQAQTNAKLIDVETRTKIEAAEAGLELATQRYKIAKDLTRSQELKQAQLVVEQSKAQMSQASVDMENARQVFERRQQLFKKDAIAREEVDEAERKFKATQATLEVARAAVDVANQRLDLAKEGSRPEEVRVAEENVRSAQQTLEQAKSDERRKQVAQEDINAADAARLQAEAALRAAKAGLVQTKLSVDEINNARATVVQTQADIQYYKTRLADLTIVAPVSGVVATRNVHGGEMVTTATKLLDLVALDTVYFEAQVPELEVSQLRPGSPADVTIDSMPGRKFRGSVREVIPVADQTSKSYRVRVAVLGGNGQLPANGFARATVFVGTTQKAVSVSKDALLTEGGDKYVWLVVDDGKGGTQVQRHGVAPGITDGGFIQILSGLKVGDRVVASGSPAILDGTPVRIQGSWKTNSTPAGAPGAVPFTQPDAPGGHGHHGGQGGDAAGGGAKGGDAAGAAGEGAPVTGAGHGHGKAAPADAPAPAGK